MTKRKDTRVELVEELENFPSTPGLRFIIAMAKKGEYHDFKNRTYACGKAVLVEHLRREAICTESSIIAGNILKLRQEVMDGEYDEPADEEDKESMRKTTPRELWSVLGLDK